MPIRTTPIRINDIVRIRPAVVDAWPLGMDVTPREKVAQWPADDLLIVDDVSTRGIGFLTSIRRIGPESTRICARVPVACVEVVVPAAHRWDLAFDPITKIEFCDWYQQQDQAKRRLDEIFAVERGAKTFDGWQRGVAGDSWQRLRDSLRIWRVSGAMGDIWGMQGVRADDPASQTWTSALEAMEHLDRVSPVRPFCVHCPGVDGHKLSCSASKNGYVAASEACHEPDLSKLRHAKYPPRITVPAVGVEPSLPATEQVSVRGSVTILILVGSMPLGSTQTGGRCAHPP